MRWNDEENAGFTSPGVQPWLPIGDASGCNVADQSLDTGSVLHLCRDLIRLRRSTWDLRLGAYRSLETDADLWAWRRGRGTIVVVNLSDEESALDVGAGTVLLGTRRDRADEVVTRELRLAPWEGLVVASDTSKDPSVTVGG